MYLGSNSNEQIHNAKVFWLPIGISATTVLLAVAYEAWRYRGGLRKRFLDAVKNIDCRDRQASAERQVLEAQKVPELIVQKGSQVFGAADNV